MSALLKAVDHVIIAVRSLEEAAPRFARLLGRPASWSGKHPGKGTENTLFRLSNMYLELMAPDGSGGDYADMLERHLEAKGEGIFGLSLETESVAQFAEEMKKRGLSPSEAEEGEGQDEASGNVRRWKHVFLPPSETLGLFVFAIEHLSPPDALPLKDPEGEAGAAVSAMDHIVVRGGDADGIRDFFGEKVLGMRLALEQDVPEWGGRMMFFRCGSAIVEAIGREGTEGNDFWGISWRVENVKAARERLASAQFDVSPVRVGRKPGTDVCTVRDCGMPTLIIGPADPATQTPRA